MKKKVLIACISLAGWMGVCASAEDLDQVVAKFYQSNGGLEKLKSLNSLTMRGDFHQSGSEKAIPAVIHSKMKKKIRIELSVRDQTIVIASDGVTPWQLIPFHSQLAQEMKGTEGKEFAEDSGFASPLLTYKEEGHKLELIGEEESDGVPVYKLKLTRKDGRIEWIFLDRKTGVQLKRTMTVKSNGTEEVRESISGDYRDVEGMMMPFYMENKINGEIQIKITVETYEINPALDDDMFSMPKKKPESEINE